MESYGKSPIYRWLTYSKWWFSTAVLNKRDGHQSTNGDFYMIPIFRMPVWRTTKDHIPCFDPSEYWAGSFVLSWCFLFFWGLTNNQATKCGKLPDLRHTDTLVCILYIIILYIYNKYQFVGLPKLSWVIHCTSFLVANGEKWWICDDQSCFISVAEYGARHFAMMMCAL